ncbi:hypothetical protein PIROE2DRAFT_65137 [Piromyces sp. E2]|nr:hypothetical protein PIROE2DRAFT_65137 [Piromyces sp. E2]|eukprot:OUM57202.1 hypothetical protein PIROE2DRAFT_65137 [Piromyces sp. E2]
MRHIRWCILISMLRIKIQYEPGKKNSLADALSRIQKLSEPEETTINENKNKSETNKNKENIKEKTLMKGKTQNLTEEKLQKERKIEVETEKFKNQFYQEMLDACENLKKNNEYWSNKREAETRFNKQNDINIGDMVKVRNYTRHKLDPYFVGPFRVVKKDHNTVTLADPNSDMRLERPVHLKNVIKYHPTMV